MKPPIKTNFFSIADGGKRHTQQVWRHGGLSMYIQGTVPGTNIVTHFAAKHLINYEGGTRYSMISEGSPLLEGNQYRSLIRQKMTRIVNKRSNENKSKQHKEKYGANVFKHDMTLPQDRQAVTFVYLDNIDPEIVRKAFYLAIVRSDVACKKRAYITDAELGGHESIIDLQSDNAPYPRDGFIFEFKMLGDWREKAVINHMCRGYDYDNIDGNIMNYL